MEPDLTTRTWREWAVIGLLPLGGLVIPIIGWFVGVFLLWRSAAWTTAEKLAGTLLWPGGYLAFAYGATAIIGGSSPSDRAGAFIEALVVVAAVAVLLAPVATAMYLSIRLVQRTTPADGA